GRRKLGDCPGDLEREALLAQAADDCDDAVSHGICLGVFVVKLDSPPSATGPAIKMQVHEQCKFVNAPFADSMHSAVTGRPSRDGCSRTRHHSLFGLMRNFSPVERLE